MADNSPPDRLSNNPRSPHFDMEALQRGVGIRFKDREREDVEEYCVSEGWIRVAAGKSVDRHGAAGDGEAVGRGRDLVARRRRGGNRSRGLTLSAA